MQIFTTLFTLITAAAVAVSAANVNVERDSSETLERRITDPGNPANLINCPPHGGADHCNLEKPCNRIRVNYGKPEGGHYIWYNYEINNIPVGIEVGVENSCTDY
ncbi:uncharacterized protein STEHIDRAFT_152700 [Stereum hirsutum FP-91666 SS1]|uniref:uncharacterized protein n=1 Tax=Stereum hirsutum (strain FP-91666) TaxID=721885 RepID=UPI000440BE86|nr:uncharacterized protein STEHIDRAFT_152700 [Stereum hirsutum FP-91666 SS1]EIM91017.1 hypothetical protein STEHIDRAFT_152700 [Stereum hirsutum FP-91666 SS1]